MAKFPQNNSNLKVAESKIPGIGRGVFATRNFEKNEQVEAAPLLEIPKFEINHLFQSFLSSYLIFYGKNKSQAALMLGLASLYNHSVKPNLIHKIYPKVQTIRFFAKRKIKIGEELTFDYRSQQGSKYPLWFE